MKTWLITSLLAFLALAGCVDDDATDPVELGPVFDENGLVASHPAYGFGTNAALLESPDGSLFLDRDDGVRQWFKTPYRGFPGAISGLEPLTQVPETADDSAGGIAVFGGLAFVGGRGAGPMNIINVMDPLNPSVISSIPDVPVRDADTILYPDGRLVVISTSGGLNVVATDVTDPAAPRLVGNFETPGSGHNIAVVPGTPIVYNSGMDIIDFSDPENPIIQGVFPDGDGCHDIAFHITNETQWALCAGYAYTEIWDIADPLAPVLVTEIAYPSVEKGLPVVGEQFDDLGVPQDVTQAVPCAGVPEPAPEPCEQSAAFPLSFSHLAIVNHDATVLIMGDETGGGGINGCDVYVDGGEAGTFSGPVGNLWFYDITDPQNPDLRGHVSPGATDADDGTGSCTAHFGRVIEDTDFLVMAFYTAGITLVDFSDLSNPRIVERLDQGGDIWDVWFHQGYLFTGDMVRGMDVIALS
ncbi:MAG: LVIVD repeat-containing protein [Thermoplasmatota archaeon]